MPPPPLQPPRQKKQNAPLLFVCALLLSFLAAAERDRFQYFYRRGQRAGLVRVRERTEQGFTRW